VSVGFGAVELITRQYPSVEEDAGGGRIVRGRIRGGKYFIICALSYNPHTNLHINKSIEA
jgi:hypothetical protein